MSFDASHVRGTEIIDDDQLEELHNSPQGEATRSVISTQAYSAELNVFKQQLRDRMVADLQARLLGKEVIFRDDVRRYELDPDGGSFNDNYVSRGTVIDVAWIFDYDGDLSWRTKIRRTDGTETVADSWEIHSLA